MPIGTVKWFNATKNYGFIETTDGDVFVHITDVEAAGFNTLIEGEPLAFTLAPGRNGRQKATELRTPGTPASTGGRRTVNRRRSSKRLKAGDRVIAEVKWFAWEKGFGFLKPLYRGDELIEGEKDLFVHIKAIPETLVAHFNKGETFEIAVGESEQGLCANPLELVELELREAAEVIEFSTGRTRHAASG